MYQNALKHFKKVDPLLYELALSIDPFIISNTQQHFVRLVKAIISQQLSTKAAATIFARLENLFKEKKITPEDLLLIPDDTIRACGISRPKISYLKDLATKVIEKEILLETLENEDNATIISTLTKVKGLGVWSAEMFMMFSLARPDIFSVGDLGVKNAMKKLYGKEDITKDEMLKISEKWSPYRTYACMILWKSLEKK